MIASARGKQTFELNKNVRWANVYDPDDDWPDPAEYTDILGVVKVCLISIILLCYEDCKLCALWYLKGVKI